MRNINLFSVLVVVVACGHFLSGAERERKSPTIEETREGEMTVLRLRSGEGVERAVYRLNLTKHHEPATARNDLIKRWESWRFGAFVCFNMNQFTGEEICKADDPKLYNPTQLDVAGWVRAFKAAGMRYAVLTARHTAPFLLWDSPTTEIDVAASGNTNDVCRLFVEECRREGIVPAFYYCLWGGEWNPDPNARAVVLAQLYELATRYGEIPYFWIDMMNWAPTNLSTQEIYDALKHLQPNTMVEFNQHVQDGTQIKYWPTDVIDGEMVPPPPGGHNPIRTVNGKNYYLPFDYCFVSQSRPGGYDYDPLGKSCWFTYGEGKSFAPSRPFSAEALAKKSRQGWERGAHNVLLAAAPDHTGRMRTEDVEQLKRLGKLLADMPTPQRSSSSNTPTSIVPDAVKPQPVVAGSAAANPGFLKARPEAVEAWKDMRFGMFICWGPVSLTGKEIGWSRGNPTPIEEYDGLYKQWKPDKFDAREWVKVAKDSGARYIVFLLKHHDGFCLWDTKQTDYNIMNGPFKRDVAKELAAACREQGIGFFPYYSTCDWHHPDFPVTSPGGKVKRPVSNLDHYTEYLEAQVKELITGYGPLVGIWFDVPQSFDRARGERVIRFVRSLQPDILVNNRTGAPGDFDTPEQQVGKVQFDRPWESCITLGTQWSWKPGDKLKPLTDAIRMLVACATGDGNLALNTNPMPDGRVEPRQVESFREIGAWLREYGESIYGTRGGPFIAADSGGGDLNAGGDRFTLPGGGWWGGSTRKDNIIYLHILRWPSDTITLPPLKPRIVKQTVLTGGKASVKQTASGIEISAPAAQRDALDTIVKLELNTPAQDIPLIQPTKATEPALARPSPAQYAWHEQERIMFVCIGVATWMGTEYDLHGNYDLTKLNPGGLDANEICQVAESWGAREVLLVAAHVGGFCWWPTETTPYNVTKIPWKNGKGNLVKEMADACRRRGLAIGLYLYPDDPRFAANPIGHGGKTDDPAKQQEWNRLYRRQWEETLTLCGSDLVREIWFDGSCQIPMRDIFNRLAPNAVILQSPAASIRWVGNEAGIARDPNWNTLKRSALESGGATQDQSAPDGDAWAPVECDTPLYDHNWFWNAGNERKRKSLAQLLNLYVQSVGHGSVLLLNSTPNTDGRIPEGDKVRYRELGVAIERNFGHPLAVATNVSAREVELDLGGAKQFNCADLWEDYRLSHRIRAYVVEGRVNGLWVKLAQGTAVGRRKLDLFAPVTADRVRVRVTQAVEEPVIRRFQVHQVDTALAEANVPPLKHE